MYCKNCGNQMNENAVVCLNCGAGKDTGGSFCSNCGSPSGENAAVCLSFGANINGNNAEKSEKTKTVAGLFAVFLGHLGVHWFYLGFKNKGIINIALTVVSAIFLLFCGNRHFSFYRHMDIQYYNCRSNICRNANRFRRQYPELAI